MTLTHTAPAPRLLRPIAAARIVNVSRETMRRYAQSAIRQVNANVLYDRHLLLRWIRQSTVKRRGFRHYDSLPDRLLTQPEAAHYSGISKRTLSRLRAENKLAWVEVGPNTIRIDRRELDSFINRESRKR